jgi:hypothetical protein
LKTSKITSCWNFYFTFRQFIKKGWLQSFFFHCLFGIPVALSGDDSQEALA